MEFLAWLEQTDSSVWLRESDWGHPIILCFHAVGMGMVVGISLMYSARILGYAKDFPISAFDRLFGLAWLGFAMNAASGVLLFFGEPRRLMGLRERAYLVGGDVRIESEEGRGTLIEVRIPITAPGIQS